MRKKKSQSPGDTEAFSLRELSERRWCDSQPAGYPSTVILKVILTLQDGVTTPSQTSLALDC